MNYQEMLAKRAQIWHQMQDIQARSNLVDAEDRRQWDEAEAELTQLSEAIERIERADRLAAIGGLDEDNVRAGIDVAATTDETRYAEAFGRFLRHGINDLDAEDRALLQANFRAQGTTPDDAGGYLAPDAYWARMTETLKTYGGLLSLANVITTSTGSDLSWPSNDDTGNVGGILDENTQASEQDLAFGTNKLRSFTYTSKIIRVSLQLMNDSAFDLDAYVPRKAGERIGRALAAHLATGNGTSQPQGIMTGAAVGVTGAAGQTTSITTDNLIDLEHSVDPAYRANGSFAFSDGVLKILRKLKDADGRPLWQPSLTSAAPSMVNGKPYVIDNGIAAPAANAKSMAFGDFNAAFVVRRVAGGQVMRLTERYADFLQVGFLTFARFDARVDDTAAVKTFVHPAS